MKKILIVLLVFFGALFQVYASDDDYVMAYAPERQGQIDQYHNNIKTATDAVNAFQEEVKQECKKACWLAFFVGKGKSCCGEIGYRKLKQKWIEISDPIRPVGGFPYMSTGRAIDIVFELI